MRSSIHHHNAVPGDLEEDAIDDDAGLVLFDDVLGGHAILKLDERTVLIRIHRQRRDFAKEIELIPEK